jgi:hypothetical protein
LAFLANPLFYSTVALDFQIEKESFYSLVQQKYNQPTKYQLKNKNKLHEIVNFEVTGHPFWRFAENRYCALNISPILIKFSPNVRQCVQNMVKL